MFLRGSAVLRKVSPKGGDISPDPCYSPRRHPPQSSSSSSGMSSLAAYSSFRSLCAAVLLVGARGNHLPCRRWRRRRAWKGGSSVAAGRRAQLLSRPPETSEAELERASSSSASMVRIVEEIVLGLPGVPGPMQGGCDNSSPPMPRPPSPLPRPSCVILFAGGTSSSHMPGKSNRKPNRLRHRAAPQAALRCAFRRRSNTGNGNDAPTHVDRACPGWPPRRCAGGVRGVALAEGQGGDRVARRKSHRRAGRKWRVRVRCATRRMTDADADGLPAASPPRPSVSGVRGGLALPACGRSTNSALTTATKWIKTATTTTKWMTTTTKTTTTSPQGARGRGKRRTPLPAHGARVRAF